MKTLRKWTITKIGAGTGSLLIAFLPVFVFAQVEVTEIMYDAPGSDSGREWIEITNTGSEILDVGKYKLFENGTNHGLKVISGSSQLLPGASAIVAADAAKFAADYPAYTATLFDSAFSLSNEGESFAIKNASSSVMSDVTYVATPDASGTGGSLHFKNGTFVAALSNPGVYPGELITVPKAPAKEKAAPKTKASAKSTSTKTPSTKSAAVSEGPDAITHTAAAASSFSIPPLFLWLTALAGILLAGVAGVIFLFAKSPKTNSLAGEFTIE